MLNKRVLLILLALCCLLFAALFYTQDQLNHDSIDEHELFIPGLADRLADVTNIQIDSQQGSIELANVDDQWLVKSKDNYPGDVAQIRKLLYGIAGLQIFEVKTSNELLLGEIGLAKDDDESIRVRFVDSSQSNISDILFGKSQSSLSGDGIDWFVRQYQSPQSWLVNGDLSIFKSTYQWLDKTILSLESDRLKQIELHPETEDAVRIVKIDKADSYTIDNLSDDEKVESYKVEQIIAAANDLKFDDVRPKDVGAFKDDIQAVNIETRDGLMILILITDSEQGWIILQAIASSPDQNANETAETFNKLWVDWEYQIPKSKIEQLLNKKKDLLTSDE